MRIMSIGHLAVFYLGNNLGNKRSGKLATALLPIGGLKVASIRTRARRPLQMLNFVQVQGRR